MVGALKAYIWQFLVVLNGKCGIPSSIIAYPQSWPEEKKNIYISYTYIYMYIWNIYICREKI